MIKPTLPLICEFIITCELPLIPVRICVSSEPTNLIAPPVNVGVPSSIPIWATSIVPLPVTVNAPVPLLAAEKRAFHAPPGSFTQAAVDAVPPELVAQFAAEVLQVPLGEVPPQPEVVPLTSHHLAVAAANPDSGRKETRPRERARTRMRLPRPFRARLPSETPGHIAPQMRGLISWVVLAIWLLRPVSLFIPVHESFIRFLLRAVVFI
ncbi:MAG: hypothetical protein BWX68_02700 [Verrucomicrobia bacterium ADurb.Bin063]|nr:MAG: hypothetical protein BWX68_02700 [Verrucomicrobia bacterium ADurb.Bin063]